MSDEAQIEALAAELPKLEGPVLIGTVFAALFSGVLYNQSATYFVRYANDRLHHVLFVTGLTLASLLALGNNIALAWVQFIKVPANPALLTQHQTSPVIVIAVPGFTTLFSQLFFSYRAYRVWDRNLLVGISLLLLSLAHFAVCLVNTIWDAAFPDKWVHGDGTMPPAMRHMLTGSLLLSGASDTVITLSIVWGLVRQRRGFNQRTDSLIMRIAKYSVTTGAITAATAWLAAILMAATWDTAVRNSQVAVSLCLPHITGIVVIGTLNLREVGAAESSRGSSGRKWTSDDRYDSGGSGTFQGRSTVSTNVAPSSRFANLALPAGPRAFEASRKRSDSYQTQPKLPYGSVDEAEVKYPDQAGYPSYNPYSIPSPPGTVNTPRTADQAAWRP